MFLIVVLSFFHLSAYSQETDYEEFDRILSGYDSLKDLLVEQPKDSLVNFWDFVLYENTKYNRFYEKVNKKKKSKERVVDFYKEVSYSASNFDGFILLTDYINGEFDFAKSLENEGVKSINNIYVYDSEEKNAFVRPDGIMCVSASLAESLNDKELLGVLAHEMAHFVLEHALVEEFAARKRQKRSMIWSAVAVAANSLASASIQANGGVKQEDSKAYWDNVQRNNEMLINTFDYKAEMAKYKYSRSQEIEADILAYRFLEYIGIDPAVYSDALCKLVGFKKNARGKEYQEGLQSLIDDYYAYDKESSHPSILYRLTFMDYIKEYDEKRTGK